MKKLFISLLIISSAQFVQCNWFGQYNAWGNGNSVIVNGQVYSCNGSTTVINDRVWCNGVEVFPNATRNGSIKDSGITETKHFPLNNVRHISAGSIGNLFIEQCKDPKNCIEKLTITADKNIIDVLTPEISHNTLKLSTKNNVSFSTQTPIEYHLVTKNINSLSKSGSINVRLSAITTDELDISTSGAGDIALKNIIAKKLKIAISGSSNIQADITADKLSIDSSGAGDITLEGSAKQQNIHLTGSQNYNAKNLESDYTSLNCSGSGKIQLNAKEKIEGQLMGVVSGTYDAKHNPHVNVKTFGMARFTKS